MIGVDGGNLHKVVDSASGAIYGQISPKNDGTVVVTSSTTISSYLMSLASPDAPPRPLAGDRVGNLVFNASTWSPDGTRLAGSLVSESGRPAGVAIYDLAAQKTTQISTDDPLWVRWLSDGRRVVYFADGGWNLVVVDVTTHKRTVVDVRLPGPSIYDIFAVSPDSRTIYYGAVRAEADIWIMERK
jgi:Tol biopolymer transport system component